MSASLPTVDHRPMSSVAIIGNDAVLAAAPATPVQLAHACLRRGFTVAVPASWGDELVAAEVVRRLASRDRGPAVMCVCPFVRSRLLGPGPDLAPFLVSIVSPPIATARYLRAVYGEHGVHITYIGGCPSADDITIDARLTPDAFLADLAEHDIALSEQPLVFDSIVPPDRRRWCSLPGGAPTAEILWSDNDARTLVEIDRDDVSTDLAQHILTREHVLLDLAPGLGCVCSGAISSLPARSARVAVTAAEPPRALGPVIDPTPVVSLDIPVAEPPASVPVGMPVPLASVVEVLEVVAIEVEAAPEETMPDGEISSVETLSHHDLMERRLDEMLGVPSNDPLLQGELEAEIDPEFAAAVWATTSGRTSSVELEAGHGALHPDAMPDSSMVGTLPDDLATPVAIERAVEPELAREPEVVREPDVVASRKAPAPAESTAAPAPGGSTVRRRTPTAMPARLPASSIPRATGTDGRALPRAYVAKRRTPPGGMASVGDSLRPMGVATADRETTKPASPREPLFQNPTSDEIIPADGPSPTEPLVSVAALEDQATREQAAAGAPGSTAGTSSMPSASADVPGARPVSDGASRSERARVGGAVTAPQASPSALVVLLVALIALGFFVLRSLN